jgi:hypothetical protein
LLDIGRPPVARRITGDTDAGIGEPVVMRLLAIVWLAGLAPMLACATDDPHDTVDAADTGTSGVSTSGDSDDFAPFVLRCDPAADDPCATFGSVSCCSDDPAALDLTESGLADYVTPIYLGRGGEGTPLFSGSNNQLSRSGYCLAEETPSSVRLADTNAQGCRAACNPAWSSDDIAAVCGPATLCCQTIEIEPADCVLDPTLGDLGCFRPVTGSDISGLGGLDATTWASTSHATHQDPSGLNCELYANDVAGLAGLSVSDVLTECFRRLTVANQRGSCFDALELDSCPFAAPNYIDACEQRNIDNGLTGCG